MIWAVVGIFACVALLALAFVCWPLWRYAGKGRGVLVAATAVFMIGVAAGCYLMLGHPELALRSIENPKDTDWRALVTELAWHVRTSRDPRGWVLLGKGYLTLDDPGDAAAAFKQALVFAPPAARPELLSSYGEALVMAEGGAVSPDAEAAFKETLAGNPRDFAARYYLGQAYAQRRDTADALALWEGLLADAPPDARWRAMLIDRIALLRATAGNAPPNVAAMVEGLAAHLKTYPNDPVGWRRLVRAYVVLGQIDKAAAALADARKALQSDKPELAQLDHEARELKLEQ